MIDLVTSSNRRKEALGCPLETLSILTGIPLSEVGRILQGKLVNNSRTLLISKALTDLEYLAAIADPIPLNFRDGARLKHVLDEVASGNMKVIVLRDLIAQEGADGAKE